MKTVNLRKSVFHILFIILFILIGYSNTLTVPFQFDDYANIESNPIIKDLRHYSEPSRTKTFSDLHIYPMYKNRFIGSLTFAINYRLNGLNVTGYHIVNIFIHIINALLVYLLIVLSFKTPFLSSSSIKEHSGIIALFTALFFACHPIQTQAVTYIVQRFTSLAVLFYLLSFVSYIKWRLLKIRDQGSFVFKTVFFYLVSVISAVLAMNTKEISFTLPVAIFVYEFMFFEGKPGKRIIYFIPFFLTILIIPLNLLNIDKPVAELIGDIGQATRHKTGMSRLDYLFTQFAVIVTYLRIVFLPVNQNLDHDFPVYNSFFEPRVLTSFSILLMIFLAGIYFFFYHRQRTPYTRLISFGIFWFFITLSVESSIIPIRDIIFEHRMYLPSVGLFVAIVTSLFIMAERLKIRWQKTGRIVIAGLVFIIFVLTGATYARNSVWRDEVTLWEDAAGKSPYSLRAQYNLGKAYQSQGFIDSAIGQYRIAIKLDPDNPALRINLGTAYRAKGYIDSAIEQYRAVNNLNPDYAAAYYNLGIIYQSQGFIDSAIEQYQTAIRLDPDYAAAYNNLGNTYQSRGLIDKAIEQYRSVIKLSPDHAAAYYNLGNAYKSRGLIDRAIERYQTAIRLDPDYTAAYNNLGILLHLQGSVDGAIKQYQTAIRLNPDYAAAYYNLGNAYKSRGLTDRAIEQYQIAIDLSPAYTEAHYSLGIVYQSQDLINRAIKHYEMSVKLNPEWILPHLKLGLIFLENGEIQKARRELENVLQINPEHNEARTLLDSIK